MAVAAASAAAEATTTSMYASPCTSLCMPAGCHRAHHLKVSKPLVIAKPTLKNVETNKIPGLNNNPLRRGDPKLPQQEPQIGQQSFLAGLPASPRDGCRCHATRFLICSYKNKHAEPISCSSSSSSESSTSPCTVLAAA